MNAVLSLCILGGSSVAVTETTAVHLKMNFRTLMTSVIAVASIVSAVAVPVTLRVGQKENNAAEEIAVLLENDENKSSFTAYSRIESYSVFSEITLPSVSRRPVLYFGSIIGNIPTSPEPTVGAEALTTSFHVTGTTSHNNGSTAKTTHSEQQRTTVPTTTSPQIVSEISVLRLINSTHPLPSNFVPQTVKMGGEEVGKVIYPYLKAMLDDALGEGVNMYIRSGYRSYAAQEAVLNGYINLYLNKGYSYEQARLLALKWASLPGCSEHQSGLAVDINVTGNTDSSTAYEWLAENAYKYGFILRYPEGKENITGIDYEPWHYRFVGVGEAKKIKNSGLCLEEYLGY